MATLVDFLVCVKSVSGENGCIRLFPFFDGRGMVIDVCGLAFNTVLLLFVSFVVETLEMGCEGSELGEKGCILFPKFCALFFCWWVLFVFGGGMLLLRDSMIWGISDMEGIDGFGDGMLGNEESMSILIRLLMESMDELAVSVIMICRLSICNAMFFYR